MMNERIVMRAFFWWMVTMLIVIGVLLVLSGCGSALCGYHGSGCTEVDKTYIGVKEVLKRRSASR